MPESGQNSTATNSTAIKCQIEDQKTTVLIAGLGWPGETKNGTTADVEFNAIR